MGWCLLPVSGLPHHLNITNLATSPSWHTDKENKVIAGLGTVYTAIDMMSYNKKRKAEFLEAQRKLEADSLEAARLAYMTGKATEEQIALVEEELEHEQQRANSGSSKSIFSVLGAPKPLENESTSAATAKVSEAASWPTSTSTPSTTPTSSSATETESKTTEKKSGLWAWMTSSLKKEEEGDDVMSAQRRLGWESLSEEDDGTGVRDSDLVRASEGLHAEMSLREKAKNAFEKEKENERKGGPLDRVGLAEGERGVAQAETTQTKKKGWW